MARRPQPRGLCTFLPGAARDAVGKARPDAARARRPRRGAGEREALSLRRDARWASRAGGYRFHLNRDRDLVHYAIAKKRLLAGLSPPRLRQLQYFIAEEGASAAAYVVIGVKGPEWILEECGDRDPSGARVGAILQVLIARDPAERRPAVIASLPSQLLPPQVAIVTERPSRDVMMI